MLTYAFQNLQQSNYEQIAGEEFDYIQDLFAAILAKGISQQLKQGLYKEYITEHENRIVMRGKLNLSETVKFRIQRSQKLACEFDELSVDNTLNQILKTTMQILLRDNQVAPERKNLLKKNLVFFDEVQDISPSNIRWERLYYQRNNKNYEMLMNLCYFVIDGMLLTTENGEYRLSHFSDDHMARLYEKFILEYYRKHHEYLSEIRAAQVKWNLSEETDNVMIRFLPVMQTDIYLRNNDKILILDAKYYGKTMQKHYDNSTLHSNNIYQIFTYVKNEDKGNTGNVTGILLYAKTDESITPDCMFNMGGNMIGAKTLDLNKEFMFIQKQLDNLVKWIEG